MAGKNCLKKVRVFLGVLRQELRVKRVYLFGSWARGHGRRDSDIDLAVISPDFEKMSPFKRLVRLGRIAWKAGTPEIEAIGYTPAEFMSASPWEFPTEIKTHGVIVA